MTHDDPKDPLEARLRKAGSLELPDAGFSGRVMAILPETRPRAAPWRPLLVGGSAALGGLIATAAEGIGPAVAHGFADLVRLQAGTPSAALALATVVAIAAVGAVLVAEEA